MALLEGRMHGEGAVMRHLTILGYKLQHEQSPLHEFDFSVGCLAADLRDGIRLCKLMELLAGEHPPLENCYCDSNIFHHMDSCISWGSS